MFYEWQKAVRHVAHGAWEVELSSGEIFIHRLQARVPQRIEGAIRRASEGAADNVHGITPTAVPPEKSNTNVQGAVPNLNFKMESVVRKLRSKTLVLSPVPVFDFN